MIGWAVRLIGGRVDNVRAFDSETMDLLENEYFHPASDGAPPDYVPAPPTAEEELAAASAKLVALKVEAETQKTALSTRVGTLKDSIELEMATPGEIEELPLRSSQLLEWKRYAVYLGRVTDQAGWYQDPEWPEKPSSGADLSASA